MGAGGEMRDGWSTTVRDANDAAGTTFLSRSCDDITTLKARPRRTAIRYDISGACFLACFLACSAAPESKNTQHCPSSPSDLRPSCDAVCRAVGALLLSVACCRTSSLTLLGETNAHQPRHPGPDSCTQTTPQQAHSTLLFAWLEPFLLFLVLLLFQSSIRPYTIFANMDTLL